MNSTSRKLFLAALLALPATTLGADDANAFLGRWALSLPGGGAGWLGVTKENGYYDASILWGGGSVVPVSSVFIDTDRQVLYVTRTHEVKRKDASGKAVRTHEFTEALIAKVDGDELSIARVYGRENGEGIVREEFTGKRIPNLPPRPDLSRVKFGPPIQLFNGRSLEGLRLTDSHAVSGWSVKDGVLTNDPAQEEGKPHKNYGNIRTDREFEDFNLKLEVNVPPKGNSGIYLRGIYEVQVEDSYGQPTDSHRMGGVYSRITPRVNAAKPAGQWQTYDITLVDRHITVILNGETVIDNQPVLGCTGGALWADEFRPGPIYFQGDHTGASYRNITLRPVVK